MPAPGLTDPRPALALVHGWGMNARVFDALAAALADGFDVRALELPGHGGRTGLPDDTLAAWADDLAQRLPPASVVLGWSLGGQVAMRAALDHPDKIARLVLLTSTPRFVATADWPHGMAAADLDVFGAALLADPRGTLGRFLALQTRGAPDQKTLLQALRRALAEAPEPAPAALAAGLAMLRSTDLRAEARRIEQPALVIHGALDTLTPAGAGRWLAAHLPHARALALPRAAHAPHLSHTDAVAAGIHDFCHA